MQALLIANTGDDDPGYVGERLVDRGYTLEVRHRDQSELPTGLGNYSLVVLLGSDWSVYWEHLHDNVQRESSLVRQVQAADVPLLGICYGAQLMSHALGGSVEAAKSVEIGWFDVTSDGRVLPPGPWFEYHVDTFTPPPGARVLASTVAGPQAYQLGRMLAVQFHPEVSPDIVRRWAKTSQVVSEKFGVDFETICDETEVRADDARRRAHLLVDAFLDDVATSTQT